MFKISTIIHYIQSTKNGQWSDKIIARLYNHTIPAYWLCTLYWKENTRILFKMSYVYLSMLGFKLIHVNTRVCVGGWWWWWWWWWWWGWGWGGGGGGNLLSDLICLNYHWITMIGRVLMGCVHGQFNHIRQGYSPGLITPVPVKHLPGKRLNGSAQSTNS